jgi:transposase InsO family protein
MQVYVAATRDRLRHPKTEKVAKTGRKAEKQTLRRAEEALREARYQVRERRKQEDAAWRALRKQFKAEKDAYQTLSKAESRKQREVWDMHWQAAWERRRASLQVRQSEDSEWRTKRQQIREQVLAGSIVQVWLAILVVTDNCTRQCLGLPLFVTGPKVTAETVVIALEALLPLELQYLISDQGSHFRTRAFDKLVERHDFIWVPIARHRAQSNGIAERFVRTLKKWLADKEWQSSEELAVLLAAFVPEYNDRPHQGLSIPGLSPNEFAKRIWLM